ncbi:MAG: hybrid sensor histidine kinase/response regulator, partial [Pseudomonadota bacterium]
MRKKTGLYRLVRKLSPKALLVLLVGIAALAGSFFIDHVPLGLGVFIGGACVSALALTLKILAAWYAWRQRLMVSTVARFVENDASPSLMSDATGALLTRNRAADDRLRAAENGTLASCFADLFANPSQILFRLQTKALALGAARDEIVTRRGHVRLTVHALSRESFLWRVEDIVERQAHGSGAQGLSLPMMTVSGSGAVLFMNEAMRKLIGGRAKSIDRVFRNLPVRSGHLNEVSSADGPLSCLVAEVEGSGGRREIFLLPAAHGDAGSVAPPDRGSFPHRQGLRATGIFRGVRRAHQPRPQGT